MFDSLSLVWKVLAVGAFTMVVFAMLWLTGRVMLARRTARFHASYKQSPQYQLKALRTLLLDGVESIDDLQALREQLARAIAASSRHQRHRIVYPMLDILQRSMRGYTDQVSPERVHRWRELTEAALFWCIQMQKLDEAPYMEPPWSMLEISQVRLGLEFLRREPYHDLYYPGMDRVLPDDVKRLLDQYAAWEAEERAS